MKVGIDVRILSYPITGIGRYTLEMCRALSDIKGVSLYLYSPSPINNNIVSGLESATIRTHSWNNVLLRQFWSETYLPLWAKKDDLDVFWGPSHRIPRFLSSRIARIVTIHDLVWKCAKETMHPTTYFLERFKMPTAVREADLIVVDSYSTKDAVIKEFVVKRQNISVIPLATGNIQNTLSFDSLKKYGIDKPYFLFVGTLEPRKNLANLLSAYAGLSISNKSKAMFIIAGGKGWGRVNLKEIITQLDLTENVKILGYVDDATLATLYSNAQFLVLPSLYEGFGLPLIEAMSYGTPVLTANNSSMPEVSGNAGLLVDALDVESIANGLQEMITNNELRERLAKNAKLNASRFSWDESAKKLITVFEKAIDFRKNKSA
jgi:glycosyltransferase involved in cell wall biosynthesis